MQIDGSKKSITFNVFIPDTLYCDTRHYIAIQTTTESRYNVNLKRLRNKEIYVTNF